MRHAVAPATRHDETRSRPRKRANADRPTRPSLTLKRPATRTTRRSAWISSSRSSPSSTACASTRYTSQLIKRQQGRIQGIFAALPGGNRALNPHNAANLKQVGRSLYLLGKHKAAVDVYDEAQRVSTAEDWEIWHNKGLCHMYPKQYDESVECFQSANDGGCHHDTTYRQMGKVFTLQERYQEAVDVYLEALEFSPDNPELLTTVGLLYLRMGENYRVFEYLGNSFSVDLRRREDDTRRRLDHSGSQRHGRGADQVPRRGGANPEQRAAVEQRGDVLLRQAQVHSVHRVPQASAVLWTPFEWIIAYNLGLVHLTTGQCASAFHFFSSSINLKPDFPAAYMYLAVTLARLDDFENACAAYDRAAEVDGGADFTIRLNYAITLFNGGDAERRGRSSRSLKKCGSRRTRRAGRADPDVETQAETLRRLSGCRLSIGLV